MYLILTQLYLVAERVVFALLAWPVFFFFFSISYIYFPLSFSSGIIAFVFCLKKNKVTGASSAFGVWKRFCILVLVLVFFE